MSNNKNTYIVLPSGKECKLKNPFPIEDLKDGFYVVNFDHLDFEATNPTYAITEVMPEGETFEGSEVWQWQDEVSKEWIKEVFNSDHIVSVSHGLETRIAIKPLKVKEPAKETNLITERKETKYYADRVEDIIDLLYTKFYQPIEHEQWFRDKPKELKNEAFYEWLNTELYNKSF